METDSTTHEATEVFGTAFLGVLKYIKEHSGKEGMDKIFAEMDPQDQQVFQRRIIAVAQYSYPTFVSLLRTADRILGSGDLSLCREFGKFAANLDMRAIYSTYRRNAGAKDLARDSTVIWNSYYKNAGRMEPVDFGEDHSLLRILDFPQMDQAHCLLMEGWIEGALMSCGTSMAAVKETACTSTGGQYHEFDCSWKL